MTFLSIFRCVFIFLGIVQFTPASANDVLDGTLRVGFHSPSFNEYSKEELEISVGVLTEQMGSEIGLQTTVTVYNDIRLMKKDFEQGTINLIFASPLLISTVFDKNTLADGFKMVLDGGNPDTLVVITRKNEGLDDFNLLKGKRLALVENDPSVSLYMNLLSLSAFKKEFKDVFTLVPVEKRSHQVILKLFFNQADVICVYYNYYKISVELNPQLNEKLQIISQGDGFLQSAGFFHTAVNPEFREKIINEALRLHTYPRGKQFLEVFKTEKAERINAEELSLTRRLYEQYVHLKN
jgi:ABC-type phosphate/phosphonate transport system substrate-binding protein